MKMIKFAVIALLLTVGGITMYQKIGWENRPSTKTPTSAENFEHMDEGIYQAHSELASIPNQLATKVDKVTGKGLSTNDYTNADKLEVAKVVNKAEKSYVDTIVGTIADGTPLFADSVSGMTDTTRLYVNVTDGMVYAYNGTTFVSTGILYQSTGINDNSITPTKTTFLKHVLSANLINPNTLDNGYLSSSGLVVDNNYRTTDYIPVSLNDVVKYFYDSSLGSNNNIYIYDSSKIYITRQLGTADAELKYRTVDILGSSLKYVRVSFHINNLGSAMLTINESYPEEYNTYRDELVPDDRMVFSDAQLKLLNEMYYLNPLAGKIVTFNGDSITYGAGFTGGYGKIIAEENDMVYENRSAGGATIAAGVLASDGVSARHWICRDIINMRSDADYIILQGGINDATLSVPMGEISNGYDAVLDDTTFCGAVESMFKQAIERYPGKKIGFILMHFAASEQQTYFPYIRDICEKWGIPYLDLLKEVPPIRYINTLKTQFTLNSDGVHPNEAGYRAFYVDRIASWLKTL